MKVTKIQFNSYIQSSPPKPQQRKSKNISSKRLIYQLKKNNKLSNNSLYILNKTAVASKNDTSYIQKIRQYNQDYDISLQSNLLRRSPRKASQIESQRQKFDNPEAKQLQISKNKSLDQHKKWLRSQHRKSRSNYHQNRYQNAGSINPYTKQQYLYFRRSKKLVSPQNHMKIRKIKQMTKPCFISGIELIQRVSFPKTQINHISRPRSSYQYRKTKNLDQNKKYRTIKKEDCLQPWGSNDYEQNYL